MIENIGQFMEFLDEFLELPGWLTGAGEGGWGGGWGGGEGGV